MASAFDNLPLFPDRDYDTENLCPRCLMRERRPGQGYCRQCHNARMRETRPRHRELPAKQRRRANTRSYTNQLVKRGKMNRFPCAVCGGSPAQAHHPDYDDARTVVWLCEAHHRALHRGETAAKVTTRLERILASLSEREAAQAKRRTRA